MADLIDEHGNPVQLADEHGNPVNLTDEHGNPVHLTGLASKHDSSFGTGVYAPGSETIGEYVAAVGVITGQSVYGTAALATEPPGVYGDPTGAQQQLRRSGSSSSSSVNSVAFFGFYFGFYEIVFDGLVLYFGVGLYCTC